LYHAVERWSYALALPFSYALILFVQGSLSYVSTYFGLTYFSATKI
jgi:hypothetical protein